MQFANLRVIFFDLDEEKGRKHGPQRDVECSLLETRARCVTLDL